MKGQYKYIKLNNNRKTISVGDWTNDKTSPSTEDLEPRIQVSLKCNSSLLHRIINLLSVDIKMYNYKIKTKIGFNLFRYDT